MSYILDALRRADAERERGAVPGLHAQPLPGAPLPGGGQRPAWVWAATVAGSLLVLGLCAAVWWLWQRGPSPSAAGAPMRMAAADPQAAAAASTAPPATTASAGPVTSPSTPSPTPAPPPVQATAAPPVTATPARPPAASSESTRSVTAAGGSTANPAGQPDRERPATRSPREDKTPTQAQPQPTPKAKSEDPASTAPAANTAPRQPAPGAKPPAEPAPSPERRIYTVDELPPEIRGSLPAVAISGSIYSEDPASRFLMVNGEVVHEGGRLGPDLTLEQIQPKTAVLRYKGYRYRIRF